MIRKALGRVKRTLRNSVTNWVFDYMMQPDPGQRGRILFDADELKLVRQALKSQHLCCIDGTMVPAFEKAFAQAYGSPYAVASTSGTAAIHVALGALDLNPGSEVITAPITDLGTIIPILSQNCIPVFADIDDAYNMDPADVERKITAQTKAILVVHLFGNPCDMDAMVDIARRHRLPLIEDCSQAHMTEYKGRYVGTIGDIGCFSFQQAKHMTTGDGGMTITANKQYYERMKLFADKGYARKGYGTRAYLFHAPNYRMPELIGAVGLAQLKKVAGVVKKRHELGEYMSELLSRVPGVRPASTTSGGTHSYWLYPIRVEQADVHRLAEEMRTDNVHTMPGYTGKPIYLCAESLRAKKTFGDSQWPFTGPWVRRTYEYTEGLCPRAEKELGNLLCLFWDESWTSQRVEHVAKVIEKALGNLASTPGSRSVVEPQPARITHSAGEKTPGIKKVRIGIIGCGQMGRWHVNSYKRNSAVEMVAFADTNFASADKFASEVGGKAYSSSKDMIISERLDGVSVCTVPSTHRDVVMELLEKGIHVLCEKPLAISVEQANDMTAKAAQKELLLLTAFKFRFREEVQKAKELIASGGLGKIVTFRLMFGGYLEMGETWYAKKELSGGGILMDNGPHAVDLIRYLFGEINHIAAEVSTLQPLSVEDTARLNFALENGVRGTADMSWSIVLPSQAYLEIYGEDGTALLDWEGLSYKFKLWTEWKRVPNRLDVHGMFDRQIDHFVEAITHRSPQIVRNEEGRKAQLVLAAAYESVKQNRPVSTIS